MWIDTKRLAVEGLQPPAPPLRPQEARCGMIRQDDAKITVLPCFVRAVGRLAFAVGRLHVVLLVFAQIFPGAVRCGAGRRPRQQSETWHNLY